MKQFAARLLNDQAAIYVSLGDPVRATHLLERPRELFEGRLRSHADDVMAVEELAETHHLLARLPCMPDPSRTGGRCLGDEPGARAGG
jgi:hypothetical protein